MDYNITPKDHLSGRFSHQSTNTYQAPVFGSFFGGPAGGGGLSGQRNCRSVQYGGNYENIFSSTLFTEARVGVAHLRNTAQQTDYGSNDC